MSQFNSQKTIGKWCGNLSDLQTGITAFKNAVSNVGQNLFILSRNGENAFTHSGTMIWGEPLAAVGSEGHPLIAFAPALHPSSLGDASFRRDLGVRYAYVVGAMANGITSVQMVRAAGQAGMIGFFGSAGLSLQEVEHAIDRLEPDRGRFPYGFNLIHSPNDPELEMAVVDLFLKRGIRLVSASAYLALTLPLVYFRVKGIHMTPAGEIVCPNRIVGKVSRVEVGSRFFAPPPPKILNELLRLGKISAQEAELAQHIPLAQDITAEADSGGHTDNRPAITLLPTFLALRNEAMRQYAFSTPLRVGLGGGIATPDAAAGAFAMGAAYVLTGSVNQACIESGTSDAVREMLAQASQADVTMAPAADMFEMGVKVQVLKRGTMFAMRGAKLYDLYRAYDRYDKISEDARATVEKDYLRASFDQAWESTRRFFEQRDPQQVARAERDPKHKMALVFRSYLGLASVWANEGEPSRKIDYQIWCGPAMGAFNAWVKGTFLEEISQRRTATVALNLLFGAAVLIRCSLLRYQGITVPAQVSDFKPRTLEEIDRLMRT